MNDYNIIPGPWDGATPPQPPGDYIEAVFGREGYLSKTIPNYEPRPSQVRIVQAIDEAIRTRRHVIAEGPTGTGKSLAYSVPAAYHAIHSGRRFCIVTSNKTLQQQIFKKDLVTLQKAVPWPFTFAIRKGIKSYLCERNLRQGKYERLLAELQGKKKGEQSDWDREQVEQIWSTIDWANTTDSGDSEEITKNPPSRRVWNCFSTDADSCDGRYCAYAEGCFPRRTKAEAEFAHIVITNYWLFFMHLRNSTPEQQSPILPPVDVAILDEAHNAPEIARGFWGLELSKWTIRAAISHLRMSDLNQYEKEGDRIWDECFSETDYLWYDLERRQKEKDIRLRHRGELKTERLELALERARTYYLKVSAAWDPGEFSRDDEMKAKSVRFAKKAAQCESCRSKLELFRTLPLLDVDRWRRQVYYVDRDDDSKDPKLYSKALFVGQHLHHKLFQAFPTVVQTSATLAIAGRSKSSFAHLKEEMGMVGLDPIELAVESPFRWSQQCMLVIPDEDTIPSYTEDYKAWEAGIGRAVESIIRLVGGRTMVLFTALARMKAVREHLEAADLPFNLYCQGDSGHNKVKLNFIEDTTSVLLGSKRFSEGIDVQGESCTCVIIDKLPFTQPNDPVLNAIGDMRAQEEHVDTNKGGRLAFMEHSVPAAIISFKQRLGRLIRTVSDVGIVVTLDDRLKTKGYGSQFLRSIPAIRQTRDINDIKPFLESVGAM